MVSKFSDHGEEMKRENRVFGNGEVLGKTADEDESADGNSGSNEGYRVSRLSEVCQSYQEKSQSDSEKSPTNEVQLLELLPASLVVVVARMRRRKVEDCISNDNNDGVDDTNIVAPSPTGLESQLVCNEYAQGSP